MKSSKWQGAKLGYLALLPKMILAILSNLISTLCHKIEAELQNWIVSFVFYLETYFLFISKISELRESLNKNYLISFLDGF